MIDFLVAITREAGNIILKTPRTIRGEKEGGGNWVTEADLASQAYLIGEIQKGYPGHQLLSEETAQKVRMPWKEPSVWIIDPLDGTTNATRGIPHYAVSVAYAERGRVQHGAIYIPVTDDLFWVSEGFGSFLNGERIFATPPEGAAGTLANIGSPYHAIHYQLTDVVGDYLYEKGMRRVNFGSAAVELALVACGKLDAYYESGLRLWDTAAGMLLVREAGGTFVSHNGDFQPEGGIIATGAPLNNLGRSVIDYVDLMTHD